MGSEGVERSDVDRDCRSKGHGSRKDEGDFTSPDRLERNMASKEKRSVWHHSCTAFGRQAEGLPAERIPRTDSLKRKIFDGNSYTTSGWQKASEYSDPSPCYDDIDHVSLRASKSFERYQRDEAEFGTDRQDLASWKASESDKEGFSKLRDGFSRLHVPNRDVARDSVRSAQSKVIERDNGTPPKSLSRDRNDTSTKSHSKNVEEIGASHQKEAGSAFEETDTRYWKNDQHYSTKGWNHSSLEEMGCHVSHGDGWREATCDTSFTFFHFGKKGGSEQDRRTAERCSSIGVAQVGADAWNYPAWEKPKIDVDLQRHETIIDDGMDIENGRGPSSRDANTFEVQPLSMPLEKVEDLDSSATREGSCGKKEGALPDEVLLQNEKSVINLTEKQKAVDNEICEEQVVQGIPKRRDGNGDEQMLVEGAGEDRQTQKDNSLCSEKQCELSGQNGKDKSTAWNKEGEEKLGRSHMGLHIQSTVTKASLSKNTEIGANSEGGPMHEGEMPAKQQSPEKVKDSIDELNLSLCTRSNGETADSDQERFKTSSQHNAGDNKDEKEGNSQPLKQRSSVPAEETSESLSHGHKQKKVKLESLQLSLALPGMSKTQLDGDLLSGPVEPESSIQSLPQTQTQTLSQTRTTSNGFTTSLSLSQSQSFIHNPSCSLNCTSMENQELSCAGSKQFSQGNELLSHRSWPVSEQMSNGAHTVMSLPQDRSKHRRGVPPYQHILQGGNTQRFPPVSGSSHLPQRNYPGPTNRFRACAKILDSSSQELEVSGRQTDLGKHFPDRLHQQDPRLMGLNKLYSQETQKSLIVVQEKARLEDHMKMSVKDEAILEPSNRLIEKLGLQEIATEAVAIMAQKLQELPDSFLDGLKGLAREVLSVFDKREEFLNLQNKIERRTDLTEETLLLAHRTQLEVLVALKMGMQEFVQEDIKRLTNTALIEIFLQTKCRNIACQLSLPVYGCECRICSQRKGFCHECNCVLCFKFDGDTSTCRWVGCDFCMHWCHTDCGLRRQYIAPALNEAGAEGATEMQYKCASCGHHVELFGFIKEVFNKFSNAWGSEVLARELDCVRRIFHGSKDMKGKQLCFVVEQMLQKLEKKADPQEVCKNMLRYFDDGKTELDGAYGGVNKKQSHLSKQQHEHAPDPLMEVKPKLSSHLNMPLEVEKARPVHQTHEREIDTKRVQAAQSQYDRTRIRAEIEDMENIVRIKNAESDMFHERAEEALQEAKGLERIISVKRAKAEEDYACKYAKLRLCEAEEKRAKRFEELQALQRAQCDYQKMKTRLEGEIKDLLMRMEVTKRQFAG